MLTSSPGQDSCQSGGKVGAGTVPARSAVRASQAAILRSRGSAAGSTSGGDLPGLPRGVSGLLPAGAECPWLVCRGSGGCSYRRGRGRWAEQAEAGAYLADDDRSLSAVAQQPGCGGRGAGRSWAGTAGLVRLLRAGSRSGSPGMRASAVPLCGSERRSTLAPATMEQTGGPAPPAAWRPSRVLCTTRHYLAGKLTRSCWIASSSRTAARAPAYGPWQTVYGLFRRWQRDGTWRAVLTGRCDELGLREALPIYASCACSQAWQRTMSTCARISG